MKGREQGLIQLRPEIPKAAVNEHTTPEEQFQNRTLRPIIKLQHELLIHQIQAYFRNRKNVFYTLKTDDKNEYLDKIYTTDNVLKIETISTIVALFTVEEYQYYTENKQKMNKRIVNMVKQRCKDTLEKL